MTTHPDAGSVAPQERAAADVPMREVDLETLKALSHPLRVRLWDLLVTGGPATSTTLARQTGESTGSTSYHLRRLAAHGLVEELPDRGTGRERWWHSAPGALRFRGSGAEYDSPSGAETVRAFGSQWASLRASSNEAFHERVIEGTEPEEWIDASSDSTSFGYLTLGELEALSRELEAVFDRYVGQRTRSNERPSPAHRRVEVNIRAFPVIDPREEGFAPRA